MKHAEDFNNISLKDEKLWALIENLHPVDIERLEEQIDLWKMIQMCKRLNGGGLEVFCSRTDESGEEMFFPYIMVKYDGDLSAAELRPKTLEIINESKRELESGVWATLRECRSLLDSLRDLPIADAYARWQVKIEPFDPTYTREQAIADTHASRDKLKQQLDSGKIDAQMYRDIYPTTSFMDLAE